MLLAAPAHTVRYDPELPATRAAKADFEHRIIIDAVACVAGRRKGERKVKMSAILPRFARSSFPFPFPSDACHGFVKGTGRVMSCVIT